MSLCTPEDRVKDALMELQCLAIHMLRRRLWHCERHAGTKHESHCYIPIDWHMCLSAYATLIHAELDRRTGVEDE